MTYEKICNKIGFDPIKDGYNRKTYEEIDDTVVSPFSVLTIEEIDFLYNYLKKHR